jgi:hypothetical protein
VVIAVGLLVATALSLVQFEAAASGYRLAVKTPMCVVVERDARTMNGMARILGQEDLSAGVIDLGGQALVSNLRLIDLGGLGTAETADYLGRGDLEGLRDYTLNVAKPDLITFINNFSRSLGFNRDPTFYRDYELVYSSWGPWPGILRTYNRVSYWVRRDVVRDEATLAELRAYTKARVEPILKENTTSARRGCGPVLRPGQTA